MLCGLGRPWNTQTPSEDSESIYSRPTNSTASLEDEEEVFYEIDEDILSQLPPRLRQNLQSLRMETFERLSRTNPNFEYRAHNPYQTPTGQQAMEEETKAVPYQSESGRGPASGWHHNSGGQLEASQGSSRYLSVRNPDPRTDRKGKGKAPMKKVEFDMPEFNDDYGGDHGNAAAGGLGNFEGMSDEEVYQRQYRLYREEAIRRTSSSCTVAAGSQTVLSDDQTLNPAAPYTSRLRWQASQDPDYWVKTVESDEESGEESGQGTAEGKIVKRKGLRPRWLRRLYKLIGRKDIE